LNRNKYRLFSHHARNQSVFLMNGYDKTADMRAGKICNSRGEAIRSWVQMRREYAYFFQHNKLYSGIIIWCRKGRNERYGPYAYVRYYDPETGKMKWKYGGKIDG